MWGEIMGWIKSFILAFRLMTMVHNETEVFAILMGIIKVLGEPEKKEREIESDLKRE